MTWCGRNRRHAQLRLLGGQGPVFEPGTTIQGGQGPTTSLTTTESDRRVTCVTGAKGCPESMPDFDRGLRNLHDISATQKPEQNACNPAASKASCKRRPQNSVQAGNWLELKKPQLVDLSADAATVHATPERAQRIVANLNEIILQDNPHPNVASSLAGKLTCATQSMFGQAARTALQTISQKVTCTELPPWPQREAGREAHVRAALPHLPVRASHT